MTLLIKNIKQLLQVRDESPDLLRGKDMATLPILENAFVFIEDDTITDYGPMSEFEGYTAETVIDAKDKIVLPSWCDSHTHIVYAGNRVKEFVDRINGLSYTEIAERGGGILNSAKLLQNTSEEVLYAQAFKRVNEVIRMGTGALEIKSGYGLDKASELKMLRVIKRLQQDIQIPIKATFLGAHAIPAEYKDNKEDYLNLLIDEILPIVKKEELADYIDIFCEKGYFDLEDTDKILKAGTEAGLIPKIHVNQFNAFGGIKVAVKHKALSVDHLEVLNDEDIEVLKGTATIPVALPSCSYFLSIPYTPARKLIDYGLPLALATDYNPGSTPSGNMNFVVSTACIKMKMTPEEAINAATINGAYAMGLSNRYGSITRGKKANLIITKDIPNYQFIPYSFGDHNIDQIVVHGKLYT